MDKLKDLLTSLPEVEPKESSESLTLRVLKRELTRLWEKRLSFLLAFWCSFLGYFLIQRINDLTKMLGTADFWAILVTDKAWLLNDRLVFWQALREANPWPEIFFIIFLLVIFFFSLYILLKSLSSKMKSRSLIIPVLLVLVLAAGVIGYRFLSRPARPSFLEIEETEEEAEESVPEIRPTVVPSRTLFLDVTSPVNGTTVKTNSVEVRGRTLPDAEIFVNDTPVYPDKNGSFSIKVDLSEGENPLLISAGNEFGDKETEITIYYELE